MRQGNPTIVVSPQNKYQSPTHSHRESTAIQGSRLFTAKYY